MNTENTIKIIIDLGCANGWSKATNDEYLALRKVMIPNTQTSKELGRCYNEYRFDALVEGQIHTVVHTVDSGD